MPSLRVRVSGHTFPPRERHPQRIGADRRVRGHALRVTGKRGRRGSPHRWRHWISWSVAALVVVPVILVVPNRLRAEPTHGLRPEVRASVREAVHAGAGCDVPFAHLAEIHPTEPDLGVEQGFTYRCTLSLVGPSFTGTAQCADGSWMVTGWRESQVTGKCGFALPRS